MYRESDAVTRALRDYLADDIGEMLVDDDATFAKAQEYMKRFMPPEAQKRLKRYTDDIPLFTRFQIESQIESAYAHKVELPSGGSSSIDYTEALVSIDINSARATRGSDIETTATNTNLEAAEEIARQLRIRDIGGLIVIDFIDMESPKNQRDVEDRLRDAVKMDRARIQIGRLSRFGLLEMSRQRLRPRWANPATWSARAAPASAASVGGVHGAGHPAADRRGSAQGKTAQIVAQVPVEVATYLMNEKREWLRTLEDKSEVELHGRAEPAHPDAGVFDPARAHRRNRPAREQAAQLQDARAPAGRGPLRHQAGKAAAGTRGRRADRSGHRGARHRARSGSGRRRRGRGAAGRIWVSGRVSSIYSPARPRNPRPLRRRARRNAPPAARRSSRRPPRPGWTVRIVTVRRARPRS